MSWFSGRISQPGEQEVHPKGEVTWVKKPKFREAEVVASYRAPSWRGGVPAEKELQIYLNFHCFLKGIRQGKEWPKNGEFHSFLSSEMAGRHLSSHQPGCWVFVSHYKYSVENTESLYLSGFNLREKDSLDCSNKAQNSPQKN